MSHLLKIDEEEISLYNLYISEESFLSRFYYFLSDPERNGATNKFDSATAEKTVEKLANREYQVNNSFNSYERKIIETLSGYKVDYTNLPVVFSISCSVLASTSTNDVFSHLRARESEVHPKEINPIAVRYISKDGTYFIERPPFELNVDFRKSGSVYTKKIWIPWTLSVLHPSNPSGIRIYFSNSSLQDMDTKYIPCILPNSYENGAICFSHSLASPEIRKNVYESTDIRQIYSFVFNEYMNGGYNDDLSPNMYFARSIDINQKKYPTLYKFFDHSYDYVKQFYKKMNFNSFNQIVKRAFLLHRKTDRFRYMFMMLGTFDVQETLKFYEEYIDFNQYNQSIPFSKIISDNALTQESSFANVGKLSSAISIMGGSQKSTSSHWYTSVKVLIHNIFAGKSYDEVLKNDIHGTIREEFSKNANKILHLITQRISDKAQEEFYIYDFSSNNFERVESYGHNSYEIYLDFIRDNISTPVESKTNEVEITL